MSVDYDVDKRFAHLRVEVLGREYTDVVRVGEELPRLPDGITVSVEHVDAVDKRKSSLTTETAADKCDLDDYEYPHPHDLESVPEEEWDSSGGADYGGMNYSHGVYERIKEEEYGWVLNVIDWYWEGSMDSHGITGEDLIEVMRLTDGDVCLSVDFEADDYRPSYATWDSESESILYDGPFDPHDYNVIQASFVDTWVEKDHIDVVPVLREETTFVDEELSCGCSTDVDGRKAVADGGDHE